MVLILRLSFRHFDLLLVEHARGLFRLFLSQLAASPEECFASLWFVFEEFSKFVRRGASKSS
jgi:hypothetical protein